MLDAWSLHAGLAAVGLALLGVTSGLPTHPPPDATGVARVVARAIVVLSGPRCGRSVGSIRHEKTTRP